VVFGQEAEADTTAPVITPSISGTLGNNGWYTSNVTVSSDTAGVSFTCQATSDGGTDSNSVTLKRDATAPALAPTVSPNPVPLNGSATASPNAGDATSGIAVAGCDPVDTSSVGGHSVNCTATDQAGNTAGATASYSVGYSFTGFFAPVDNPPVLNNAKAGQAIPLKWRLTDANGLINVFPLAQSREYLGIGAQWPPRLLFGRALDLGRRTAHEGIRLPF